LVVGSATERGTLLAPGEEVAHQHRSVPLWASPRVVYVMIEGGRYAVVSCHVERLLDDTVWKLFRHLLDQASGAFRIAALLRPPDPDAGEAVEPWLDRARTTAARSPLGHHTHWGGPATARPVSGNAAEQVRHEGEWLRRAGLRPTLFCGGGWYFDTQIAEAVAELGYVDCTATSFRPRYLAPDEPHLEVHRPCWLEVPTGEQLLELPTTHSLGMLVQAIFRRTHLQEPLVHFYFHDTDLLNRSRRAAIRVVLALLARRRVPTDLDRIALEAASGELPIRRL
jgi:hypothetical protein